MNKKVAIIDIDNCLVNDDWRMHRIDMSKTGHERYHDYHLLSAFDAESNLALVNSFATHKVILLTARPEAYRTLTEGYLRFKLHVHEPYLLIMRCKDDHDASADYKRRSLIRVLKLYGIDTADIDFAVDDRQDIVDMYKSMHINASKESFHSIPYPKGVITETV